MKKRIASIFDFYNNLWDGLSIFGRCILFLIIVILLPIVIFVVLCDKVEED
jgi:hypothetical protein